uniref:Uncharacterized protein n=1 Tax=Romanomermis culicivorax TaxID=13658 RepID=A0A915HP55_ROMCU
MAFLSFGRKKEEDFDDDEILRFDPSDDIYKVGCNFNVLNTFLWACVLQYIFSLYFLAFTIVQLLILELKPPYFDSISSANILLWVRILYPLIYARLLLLILFLLATKISIYALFVNQINLLRYHAIFTWINSLSLVAYLILLVWHTAKSSNYLVFSLAAVSLLLALIVNASCLNMSTITRKFLCDRRRFLKFALEKNWTNEQDIEEYKRKKSSNNRLEGNFYFFDKFNVYKKYDIPKSLKNKAKRYLSKRSGEIPATAKNLNLLSEICEVVEEDAEEMK